MEVGGVEQATGKGEAERLAGIRGAVRVSRDTPEDLLEATRDLLKAIMRENHLDPEDVVSIFFTATPDLKSEFPALAARQLGLTDVALLCAQEIPVPHAMSRVVRVLVHAYLPRSRRPKHVYLGETRALRDDLPS